MLWGAPVFWLLSLRPLLGTLAAGSLVREGTAFGANRAGVPHLLPILSMIVLAAAAWALFSLRSSAARWALAWLLLVGSSAMALVPVALSVHVLRLDALRPLARIDPSVALPFSAWLLCVGLASRPWHFRWAAFGLVLATVAAAAEPLLWTVAVLGFATSALFAWQYGSRFSRRLVRFLGGLLVASVCIAATVVVPGSPLERGIPLVAILTLTYGALSVSAALVVFSFGRVDRFLRSGALLVGALLVGALA